MRGRRRRVMAALTLAGLLLIAVAVTRAELADDEHPACVRHVDLLDGADLLEFRSPNRAKADFEAHLEEDPDAACATRGLLLLVRRECDAADGLVRRNLLARAEKVYVAALDSDPGTACALRGLRAVADRRCAIARNLVVRGLTTEAAAILKSASLPDAPATCPGVVPQKTPEPASTHQGGRGAG